MAKTEFKFKQFTINQDKTAMKVGTDGVLLGAWTNCETVNTILDIGTGTGLIALMLAQKSDAKIYAIEKNTDAYKQAVENINNSAWKHKFEIINQSFQDYYKNNEIKFDLIVSNPPFFSNSLKNNNKNKAEARHNDFLPFEELVCGVEKLSHHTTIFSVILPFEDKEYFINLCSNNQLFCNKITNVKPNSEKNAKRILMQFSKTQQIFVEDILTIENHQRHSYTNEYINLTKEYYLNLKK